MSPAQPVPGLRRSRPARSRRGARGGARCSAGPRRAPLTTGPGRTQADGPAASSLGEQRAPVPGHGLRRPPRRLRERADPSAGTAEGRPRRRRSRARSCRRSRPGPSGLPPLPATAGPVADGSAARDRHRERRRGEGLPDRGRADPGRPHRGVQLGVRVGRPAAGRAPGEQRRRPPQTSRPPTSPPERRRLRGRRLPRPARHHRHAFTRGPDGLVLTVTARIGGGTELSVAGTLTTAG